jgi:peptidoglycan/xylan/chitin deacetylase (PgdA/CDA1 family)
MAAPPLRAWQILSDGFHEHLRPGLRAGAIHVLAWFSDPTRETDCVRFVYGHDIQPADVGQFGRQLDLIQGLGRIVEHDEGLERLASGSLPGRFFCLSFDDGSATNYDYLFPVLAERGLTATIFLRTDEIDNAGTGGANGYLTWAQCREMADSGHLAFGSHTHNHANLADLDAAGVRAELEVSKAKIEDQLGRPCLDFSCPWGKPGVNFRPERDPAIAREVGFRTFFTTVRGASRAGADPFNLKRDEIGVGRSLAEIRFFLARS